MKNFSRVIEILSNLFVLVAAICVLVVFTPQVIKLVPGEDATNTAVGSRILIDSDKTSSKTPRIIVAFSTNCVYCNKQAQFLERLDFALRSKGEPPPLLVYAENEAQAHAHAGALKLSLPIRSSFRFPPNLIHGTPTIFTLNSSSFVTNEWRGYFAIDRQDRILKDIIDAYSSSK